jgi:predicted permease
MRRLDGRTVATAAGLAIAVTVPPTWLVRLLKGDDLDGQESALWVVPVLALFVGFALAGHLAARRRPDAPLTHSAAAALAAFGLLSGVTVVRRVVRGDGLSGPLLITLLLLFQITVSLAVLGGYVATRREARRQDA